MDTWGVGRVGEPISCQNIEKNERINSRGGISCMDT